MQPQGKHKSEQGSEGQLQYSLLSLCGSVKSCNLKVQTLARNDHSASLRAELLEITQ